MLGRTSIQPAEHCVGIKMSDWDLIAASLTIVAIVIAIRLTAGDEDKLPPVEDDG